MATTRPPTWPHYLIAASLIFFPIYEVIASNLLPIRLGEARWRFAAFGLISPSMLLVAVGVMAAFWVANAFEHRRFQVVLGVGSLIMAVFIAAFVAIFGLDVLQVQGAVNPQATYAFRAASLVAVLRALVCGAGIAGVGVASLRAGRSALATEAQRRGVRPAATPPLVAQVPPEPGRR